MYSERSPTWLKLLAITGLVLLQLPLVIVIIHGFASGQGGSPWPFQGVAMALNDPEIRQAFYLSFRIAVVTTLIAVFLGTLCAATMARARFFGHKAVSLLIFVPVMLPGATLAIALQSAFSFGTISLGFWTIVIGHASFAILIVYNNALAHFRSSASTLIEASMDLGATGFQTFWHALLPNLLQALVAGALLAFVISFNEATLTAFTAGNMQTLPLWLLREMESSAPSQIANTVAMIVAIITLIPLLAVFYCFWKSKKLI